MRMKECCDMKGFLTFTTLRLIGRKPMSGEDLRRELEKRRGSKPSPGTIYPVLKELNQSSWIEEIQRGSNDSAKEKKYRITPKGRKELDAATKRFVLIFCDMKPEFEKVKYP